MEEKEIPELRQDEVFYFGCWGTNGPYEGHYVYNTSGEEIDRRKNPVIPKSIKYLNSAYCGSPSLGYQRGLEIHWSLTEEARPQNRGRITHIDGWTILAFWDRTGDWHYGSNSALIAKGKYDLNFMCAIFLRYFPRQYTRITTYPDANQLRRTIVSRPIVPAND